MLEIYFSYFKRQPLASIPVFLTLLPLLLIWQRKAYRDNAFLILGIYLMVKFVIDFIMFDWASHKRNTVVLYNFNVPFRYVLSSLIFYQKLETRRFKNWILASIPVFILFSIWDTLHTNPSLADLHNHKMVLYSTTVESLFMLFWVLLYFYNTIRALKIPNLLTYPFFWVCSGLLIYYSSFLFIAPVFHYSSKWEEWLEIGFLTYVPYMFESVSIILFSIGIAQFPDERYAK
ncbi:hypothetical protein DYBT9623_03307 [Dyadobacter sp. CECT 9623]|uniref:Lycopene cyclase domain-containing protein n=1 Tax=Dyadobacter linearis TaxID=2823330 RepID=A0ABN7RDP8_9BACT|nr:hypothetical protein [Dyadobacter sp. CECT 9623]CAG5070983.1 hypothetical protein DYBT9623_03307 [Dyadobacter sp. CECT 9623]